MGGKETPPAFLPYLPIHGIRLMWPTLCPPNHLLFRLVTGLLCLGWLGSMPLTAQEQGPNPSEREQASDPPAIVNPGSQNPMAKPTEEAPLAQELPPAQRVRLDTQLDWFATIEDDAPIRSQRENPDEHNAYNYTVAHAAEQSVADLKQFALDQVPFKNLIEPVRQDYRGQLLQFEGRLLRLRSERPTKALQAEGIDHLYEGYLVPEDAPSPVVIVFTELPEGVLETPPKGPQWTVDLNVYARFQGYYFKLIRYESAEKIDEQRYQWRRAPLLIGKTIEVVSRPASSWSLGTEFIVLGLAFVGLVVLAGLGLGWWFRRGDRQIADSIQARQSAQNPFADEGSVGLPPRDDEGQASQGFHDDRG